MIGSAQKLLMARAGVRGVMSFSNTDTASVVGFITNTSYTFSALSLGDADTDRSIYIAVIGGGPEAGVPPISGLSVSGVSADLVTTNRIQGASSYSVQTDIWRASLPTGATGDVVVSFSGGNKYGVTVSVYRVLGASNTLFDSAADQVTSSADINLSVNTPADGAVIACAISQNSTGPVFSGVTSDITADVYTNEWSFAGSTFPTTILSPQTITFSATTAAAKVGVAIALQPA